MKISALVTGLALAAITLPTATGAWALAPDKIPARLSLEGWQVKDGLAGDSIRDIKQATDGRLWIATFGGLVRYDGIGLAPLVAPDALKLAVADVSGLLAARDGSVWLGAHHHSPMRFFAGTLRAFGVADGLPEGALPRAWSEDGEGHVWMASTRGLFKFADDRFVARSVRGFDQIAATALQIDRTGTPWIGTAAGLFTVQGDRLVPVPVPPALAGHRVASRVTALRLDRRGILWAAWGGVLLGFPDNGGPAIVVTQQHGLPSAPIAAIEPDDDGNLWLGTPAGLVRVRDGHAQLFAGDQAVGADVTALLIDRERGLWVGTRTTGLSHLTDRTLDTHAAPPELDGIETLALCEDDDGAFWFGTRGKGAVRWKEGRATWYGPGEGLPSDTVSAMLPGDDGEVWLGTHAGLVRWRAGKIDNPGVWPGRVRTLYRDRGGALWIGGDGLLGQYAAGRLTTFTPKQGIMAGHVRALAEDDAGVLWVSGVGGLARRSGEGFVKSTAVPEKPAGAVRSMLLDSQGAFWLTTARGGLVRRWRGRALVFDARVGLEPGMLYGLLEDDGGDLWIGTNKSILRVSRSSLEAVADQHHQTLQVASFETTDRRAGVIAAQLHQPSAWKARDGALWFLTQNGPVRIDPRGVHTNNLTPRLTIDAVLADGRPVPGDGRGRVPSGAGRVEIQYTAVSLLQPTKVRYRHWLEGFDAGWSEPSDRRTAIYPHLPAGEYRFRLQASNNDGLWNERGVSLAFSVEPPFYRRIWFYLACALALVPIGLAIHRSHLARVRAQYLGMFTERSRMARELHDTLLQGMATVAMQLHSLRRHFADSPGPAPRRELDLLHDTVTRCLEETRQVVRGLREPEDEASEGALGPALTRLAQRLRATAGGGRSESDSPACAIQIEGRPRPLPHAVQDELYRIGQEALTNAWRHAEARRIDLRLCYEAHLVRLVVSDDGRGFDPGHLDQAESDLHFGIRGLRERAVRIGATLDVRSSAGAGTVIEAVVKSDSKTETKAAAGDDRMIG